MIKNNEIWEKKCVKNNEVLEIIMNEKYCKVSVYSQK